jgi:ketosteroid isomerase-like protein
MSKNLDLVRSIFADWERGDYSSAQWADPGIEYVVADRPAPGSWTGVASMTAGWCDVLRACLGLGGGVDECRELDDGRVLVLYRLTGHGRTSGLDLGQMRARGASIFSLREGKVSKLVSYLDRDRALADLELTPNPDSSDA